MAIRGDIDQIQQLYNNMVLKRKFQMMRVYNTLIKDNNKIEWSHMMHHHIARPRAKVIMWLTFQDRLLTKTRLNRLGLLQHTNCELCDEHEETMAHLMFNCKGTTNIWPAILNWLDIKDSAIIDLNWIKRKTNGKRWKMGLLKASIS